MVYWVVVLLVGMEWTAAVSGERVGLFLDFLKGEKLGQLFSRMETDVPTELFTFVNNSMM
jgi:hypothetical protein